MKSPSGTARSRDRRASRSTTRRRQGRAAGRLSTPARMAKTKAKNRRRAAATPPPRRRSAGEAHRVPTGRTGRGSGAATAVLGAAFLLGKNDAQQGSEGLGGVGGAPQARPTITPARRARGSRAPPAPERTPAVRVARQRAQLELRRSLQDAQASRAAKGRPSGPPATTCSRRAPTAEGVEGDVRPDGLPSLDIHGFALDPQGETPLGGGRRRGLYRSSDGGRELQARLGGGRQQRGARRHAGGAPAAGDDAVRPDGGASWEQVLQLPREAGRSPGRRASRRRLRGRGLDRLLYRTDDRGASWQPVS